MFNGCIPNSKHFYLVSILTMPAHGAKYSSTTLPKIFLIRAIKSPFLMVVFTPG